MKRRTFLTALATLVSWFTIRPTVHADAINGSFKTGEWPYSVQFSYFDGDRCVLVQAGMEAEPVGRRRIFGIGKPDHETIFRMSAIDEMRDEVARETRTTYHYSYESGPKWWEKAWTCPKCGIVYQNGPPWPRKPYCECGFMGSVRISREEIEASRRLTPGEAWSRIR